MMPTFQDSRKSLSPHISSSVSAQPITSSAKKDPFMSGVLYKWVNYCMGWHRRWFMLEDGVLSYYKIRHAPTHDSNQPTRPLGQVHLKVSSVRESTCKPDNKRFSIFTGTKSLHLRARTKDDRMQWMQALQAAKGMFPRMPNTQQRDVNYGFEVSTEKLRQRLLQERVSEAAIQDTERIMRTEFSALHNQLVLTVDTLGKLEESITNIRSKQRQITPARDFAHSSSPKA